MQSLLPKINLIRADSELYDIVVFSETWLKPNILDTEIALLNFLPPFRADRLYIPGGGVAIYARDTLLCKRRKDLEINGLESVLVEVSIKSKKVLVGGFYRPPNSNAAYFNLILESIDRAYNTNIHDIIITGDFNYNMLLNNTNKMSDLLLQLNLSQLITDETHFTETSASLIDLIMVRNRNNILTSGVAEPLFPDLIRYHCPVFVLLKFIRPKVNTYKRKIWNYQRADFEKYRQLLREHDLTNKIRNKELDSSVQSVADAIFDAIPNKLVNIRPSDYPWITCHNKSLIRKRRRVYNKLKKKSALLGPV